MTTAQNDKNIPVGTSGGNTPVSAVASGTTQGKESEPLAASREPVRDLTAEVTVAPEVAEVGVQPVRGDIVELPPDLKKLGVSHTGSSVPVTNVAIPPVSLPISDSAVVSGLHAKVTSSLKWLSVWCIKKLTKAHVMLKIVHGKITRVSMPK